MAFKGGTTIPRAYGPLRLCFFSFNFFATTTVSWSGVYDWLGHPIPTTASAICRASHRLPHGWEGRQRTICDSDDSTQHHIFLNGSSRNVVGAYRPSAALHTKRSTHYKGGILEFDSFAGLLCIAFISFITGGMRRDILRYYDGKHVEGVSHAWSAGTRDQDAFLTGVFSHLSSCYSAGIGCLGVMHGMSKGLSAQSSSPSAPVTSCFFFFFSSRDPHRHSITAHIGE